MPTGFLVAGRLVPDAGWATPAVLARRKALDSGRYLTVSGTSSNAGSAPMMNIQCHPNRSITTMPSSAVATAPTW